MSPQVKSINIPNVKKQLKECPESVQNYVKQLERSNERKRNLIRKAISKLKNE